MGHPTLEYIKGLRKSLETKKAEIVGENPASMPGAEHDIKVPAAAKQPDPETKDQTMVPNSGLTTAGAEDDSKITHTNDLIAGEPALTPKKEPEVTADAEAKTAEALAAEILCGVNAWFAAQKQAEEQTKAAEGSNPPSAGEGTAEALITDTGKDPEQTGDIIAPDKKPEISTDAMQEPGEGSSGETAAAAKAAEEVKECEDGKCGKCAKCKAAEKASKKCAGVDMELTSDVLAKIAAVMLATEEGTQLAESVLAKAAGAEAAEKTLNFLRAQSELAEKQAEYEAGRRDALALLAKQAEDDAEYVDESGDGVPCDEPADDAGIGEIADTLDSLVESGEITEGEADEFVAELAQAIASEAGEGSVADDPAPEAKEAQAVDPAVAGDAAIDQAVAVPPENLDTANLPQDDLSDVTPEEVADAIDSLVESGEITEDDANQLVDEIVAGSGAEEGAEDTVSPEEIATALQQAVESGEITPEDVQQVLTELEGVPADAGAAPEAVAPVEEQAAPVAAPAAPAAPAAAPAALTPADEPKTAGAKLLAAIMAARQSK